MSHKVRKCTFWYARPKKTHISLPICTVWSESSASTWETLYHWLSKMSPLKILHRVIWTFTGHPCPNVHFRTWRLIYACKYEQKRSSIITLSISNKSCRRTASSPAGYILYCNIFIIKPYNIGHTDLDVFVCKSFCHLDIIIQVWQFSMK